MLNKVEYWLKTADEDISVARLLLDGKKFLQSGFFCHLIVEKSLKAFIANITSEIPPKKHDLVKLAALAGLTDSLSEKQVALLVDLTPLQVEARYPEYKAEIAKTLNFEICTRLLKETEEFLCWTKEKLEK